jgi:predicted nucleic acid-binding protein
VLRVTVDTNILISGINFPGGKPFQLLEMARAGTINLTVSDAILDEMADVLRRKFDFTPECAVAAGSAYIVTGDRDILRLGQYDAILILSAADFLELARANAEA